MQIALLTPNVIYRSNGVKIHIIEVVKFDWKVKKNIKLEKLQKYFWINLLVK